MIGKFLDASNFLRRSGIINDNVTPQLFIGSTEDSGISAEWIYNDILGTSWMQGNDNIIGGIYYGHEDATGLESMRHVSDFIHDKGKKLIWIPYFTDNEMLDGVLDKADKIDSKGNPLFDIIIIQPGAFYNGVYNNLNEVLMRIKNYKGKTKLGMEIEFDMGLVTGRRDYDWRGREFDTLLTSTEKRNLLSAYLTIFDTLKRMDIPIGVYSGGPNEQGYNNIRGNINSHNSGNHIPYWHDIIEDWYSEGVHYNEFPNAYSGGNLIYDINNYIYNGIWNDALTKSVQLDKPNK